MKTIALHPNTYACIRYPNGATRRQIVHKVLDFLLVTASCAGIAAMILLLAVLA